MFNELNRKLFWLAVWVTGFAVSMACLLVYFKYQSAFSGVQRTRVEMVAQEIDSIAEKSLSLGQDFYEIGTLQDVIDRRVDADRIIEKIDVAGKDGRIAYATDRANIGKTLPADAMEKLAASGTIVSLPLGADRSVLASPIRNAFNVNTGYALVQYTRISEHAAMRAFAERLAIVGVVSFLVFALLLFLILWYLKAGVERRLDAGEAASVKTDALSLALGRLRAAEAAAGTATTEPPRPGNTRFLRRETLIAAAAILLCVAGAISTCVLTMRPIFEQTLMPEVATKARTLGHSANSLFAQAAAHEIPLNKLVGVTTLFEEYARVHPQFVQFRVVQEGRSAFEYRSARYQSGDDASVANAATIPLTGYADTTLTIVIDRDYIRQLILEMMLDLAVVMVVALFISLELLYFLAASLVRDIARLAAQVSALVKGDFAAAATLPASTGIGTGLSTTLQSRAAQQAARSAGTTASAPVVADAGTILGAMRAPFFLLLFAEDLSRSFLPVYAGQLPIGPLASLSLSPQLVVGLPIFLFMLIVALSQPILGGWSERIGRRRSFLAGAAIGIAAHLLSAIAGSLTELLVWRSAAGAAWAIAFVAAQGYVLDNTDTRNRARGLAVFVGIIMVASICGPSIGGILADGIGSRATFFVSSALASLSAWLAWRKLPADGMGNAAPPATAKPPLSIAFANRRFLALLLFAAIPAKVVLIAYCYYLVPLFVMDTGASPAMAGRIVMLYAIMTTVLGPLAAEWSTMLSTRFPQRSAPLFIVLGLALSGLAGVLMAVPVGMFGPVIVVILLGLGQSLSISPQATMVAEICASEIRALGQSAVYGVYRMVERFGNAAAPLIAAALVETGGFRVAFVTIGLATLACTAAFAFTFLYRRQPTVIVADRSSSP